MWRVQVGGLGMWEIIVVNTCVRLLIIALFVFAVYGLRDWWRTGGWKL